MTTNYRPRQNVYVKCGTRGNTQLIKSATFVQPAGKKKLILRDEDGSRFEAKNEDVYPSKEALEASIPGLERSICGETGRVTEFPPDPSLTRDGETLWQHREAGSPSAFGARRVPDWMEIPAMLLDYSQGKLKRRIVRQFVHPSPITEKPVTARELKGGIYCFETPGVGWQFTTTLDKPEGGFVEIDGDAPPPESDNIATARLSNGVGAMPRQMVRPCLRQAHREFLASDGLASISTHLDGKIIVITTKSGDRGMTLQVALQPSELSILSPALQDIVRKTLAL